MSKLKTDTQLPQTIVSCSADDVCVQQCESCENEFDIDTMIEGEQWFCQECYCELKKDEVFMSKKSN